MDNDWWKIPNDFEFPVLDPEDNIVFQIEKNQQQEIVKLKELSDKKDMEIEMLKANARKDKKRFWITYIITTVIAIIGIILGIAF